MNPEDSVEISSIQSQRCVWCPQALAASIASAVEACWMHRRTQGWNTYRRSKFAGTRKGHSEDDDPFA